jgi:hypothetical protein
MTLLDRLEAIRTKFFDTQTTALTAALAEAWCARTPADICVDYGYDEYGKRHVTVWCFYPSHDIRTSLQTLPRV